jgi:hypothetical protein
MDSYVCKSCEIETQLLSNGIAPHRKYVSVAKVVASLVGDPYLRKLRTKLQSTCNAGGRLSVGWKPTGRVYGQAKVAHALNWPY